MAFTIQGKQLKITVLNLTISQSRIHNALKDGDTDIYLKAKVSQLLLKCYFLLFEPNILLHDIVINKSNDLPSKQHGIQTSETYDC